MRASRVFVGALVVAGMASPSVSMARSPRRFNPFNDGESRNSIDRLEIGRADLRKIDDDNDSSATRRVLTRRPAAYRPYLVGGSVAVDVTSGQVFVADTENGTVAVSAADGKQVLRVVPVGEGPEQVVVAPSGRAYVTVRDAGQVAAIEPRSTEVRARVRLDGEPFGLALSADGATLFVSLARSGEVVALDAGTLAERFRVKVDAEPRGLAVTPEGDKVFVAHLTGRAVSVIDLTTRAIRSIALPGGDKRADAGGRMPNLSFAIAMSPSGRRLYVPHVLEDTGANVQPEVRSSGYGAGTFEPIVATLTAVDAEAEELADPAMADADRAIAFRLSGLNQPRSAVVDPVYTRVFIAGLGSGDVRVLSTVMRDPLQAGQNQPVVMLGADAGPKGLALSADGQKLYVHCSFRHQLAVVDVAEPRRWGTPNMALLTVGDEKWPAAAVHGRQIFYSSRDPHVSARGQFACGSCHPEGRQDGMVWRLDKGPRQTPVLAGRLVGTAPYNWLGGRGSLQDNMKDTMGRLGGSGLPKKDLDDLELFITRYLDPGPARTPVELSAMQAHGKSLFESDEVGCAHCHAPGTLFTDGKNHDIGTTTREEVARLLADRGETPPVERVDVINNLVRDATAFLSTRQLLRAFGGRPVELNAGEAQRLFASAVQASELGNQRRAGLASVLGNNGLERLERRGLVRSEPPTRASREKRIQPVSTSTRLAYNTPSLSGVASTAPYFHDGSAANLRDVLTTNNPDDRMGRTSHLSSGEIDALVAYLETL